jgi:hypothetical protein
VLELCIKTTVILLDNVSLYKAIIIKKQVSIGGEKRI